MGFLRRMAEMQPLSYYVLSRCLLLSCTMLACALVMLVWAGEYTYETVRLYFYAEYTQTMALIVLGAGLIGSALLEDVLVHTAGRR